MAVSKQAALKLDVERSNLMKLSELAVRIEYQIMISNTVTALENLNNGEDINRAWENIKENNKISAKEILGLYEWKQHKPWFDKEYLKFSYPRKQAKMQWLQDPNQSNVGTLYNIRCEASQHFRKNKKEYLKAKIHELETKSKIKSIRHLHSGIRISDFKKGCQPRPNIIRDEKDDLLQTPKVFWLGGGIISLNY